MIRVPQRYTQRGWPLAVGLLAQDAHAERRLSVVFLLPSLAEADWDRADQAYWWPRRCAQRFTPLSTLPYGPSEVDEAVDEAGRRYLTLLADATVRIEPDAPPLGPRTLALVRHWAVQVLRRVRRPALNALWLKLEYQVARWWPLDHGEACSGHVTAREWFAAAAMLTPRPLATSARRLPAGPLRDPVWRPYHHWRRAWRALLPADDVVDAQDGTMPATLRDGLVWLLDRLAGTKLDAIRLAAALHTAVDGAEASVAWRRRADDATTHDRVAFAQVERARQVGRKTRSAEDMESLLEDDLPRCMAAVVRHGRTRPAGGAGGGHLKNDDRYRMARWLAALGFGAPAYDPSLAAEHWSELLQPHDAQRDALRQALLDAFAADPPKKVVSCVGLRLAGAQGKIAAGNVVHCPYVSSSHCLAAEGLPPDEVLETPVDYVIIHRRRHRLEGGATSSEEGEF